MREAWEETGLHVEPTRILGVYGGPEFIVRYRNGDRTSYLMVVFEARRIAGRERPDHEETQEVRYFTRDQTRTLPHPVWLDEVLDDAFGGRPAAAFRASRWAPPAPG